MRTRSVTFAVAQGAEPLAPRKISFAPYGGNDTPERLRLACSHGAPSVTLSVTVTGDEYSAVSRQNVTVMFVAACSAGAAGGKGSTVRLNAEAAPAIQRRLAIPRRSA